MSNFTIQGNKGIIPSQKQGLAHLQTDRFSLKSSLTGFWANCIEPNYCSADVPAVIHIGHCCEELGWKLGDSYHLGQNKVWGDREKNADTQGNQPKQALTKACWTCSIEAAFNSWHDHGHLLAENHSSLFFHIFSLFLNLSWCYTVSFLLLSISFFITAFYYYFLLSFSDLAFIVFFHCIFFTYIYILLLFIFRYNACFFKDSLYIYTYLHLLILYFYSLFCCLFFPVYHLFIFSQWYNFYLFPKILKLLLLFLALLFVLLLLCLFLLPYFRGFSLGTTSPCPCIWDFFNFSKWTFSKRIEHQGGLYLRNENKGKTKSSKIRQT